jgi:hypothetical protein
VAGFGCSCVLTDAGGSQLCIACLGFCDSLEHLDDDARLFDDDLDPL